MALKSPNSRRERRSAESLESVILRGFLVLGVSSDSGSGCAPLWLGDVLAALGGRDDIGQRISALKRQGRAETAQARKLLIVCYFRLDSCIKQGRKSASRRTPSPPNSFLNRPRQAHKLRFPFAERAAGAAGTGADLCAFSGRCQ